jgi:hypothetical protein
MKRLSSSLQSEAMDAFLHMLNGMEGDRDEEKVQKLFDAFDSDNNGQLDIEELSRGLASGTTGVNSKQAQVLISILYANESDGAISREQFLKGVNQMHEERLEATRAAAQKEAQSAILSVALGHRHPGGHDPEWKITAEERRRKSAAEDLASSSSSAAPSSPPPVKVLELQEKLEMKSHECEELKAQVEILQRQLQSAPESPSSPSSAASSKGLGAQEPKPITSKLFKRVNSPSVPGSSI